MRGVRAGSETGHSSGQESRSGFPNHFKPRTRRGWFGLFSFLFLFACTQPPLVFLLANRIEPRILGVPFLYAYLLVLYFALIGVLIWAMKRGL